jgi:hypothetical protein
MRAGRFTSLVRRPVIALATTLYEPSHPTTARAVICVPSASVTAVPSAY